MFNAMSMGDGAGLGFITLWTLHILSVISFFTGLVFLIILAVKTLNKTQLRNWAIGLMVVGTLVCLFTIAALGRPWVGMGGYNGSFEMMQTR